MSSLNFLDKLLDAAEVEWKPLGDVLVRTKGTKITAGQMKGLHKEDGTVKIFAGGRTVAFVNIEDIPANRVLINKLQSLSLCLTIAYSGL